MSAHAKLKAIAVKQEVNSAYQQRKPNHWTAKIEKFFYHHRKHLVWIHISMFIFFMALLIIPLFLPTPQHGDTFWNNFTEFSQFLIWGLWFPLVFVSVLFSGRSWCGILCPMGAASEWINRVGLKRPIPAWLKWEGTPILSFCLITILGQTVDVRDQASSMAEIFGGTLLLALIIGFVFGRGKNKRAWCRHVCPIGLLLGVFSRMGIIEFATKLLKPGKDRYTEQGVCPTMIAVSHKQESRHCIECFRCVKPTSSGGLFVRHRPMGEEIEQIHRYNPNIAEVWFIFLSTGLSLGGFLWLILPSFQHMRQTLGTWAIEHSWDWLVTAGPAWLMSVHPEQHQIYYWLDFTMIVGFMVGCMLFTWCTMTLTTALGAYFAVSYKVKNNVFDRKRFKKYFTALGYQFAPVAMMSIIISLSDKLFQTIGELGISNTILATTKGILLLLSLLWSFKLNYRILQQQQTPRNRIWTAWSPGALGSCIIALSWWPAIFGVQYSILTYYRTHLIPM